jgi:hypothetical protein
MRIYRRQLKPEGILAFHISNSHLDLQPVIRAVADRHGLRAVLAPPVMVDPREGKLAAMWMMLSANREFLRQPDIAALMLSSDFVSSRPPLLWTDDYSSLLPILH